VGFAEALGWLAVVLTFARLGSQPWHNLRKRQVQGVSPTALGNNFVADLGWLWYGIEMGLAPVWVVALIIFPVNVTAIWVARSTINRSAIAITTAWLAALVAARVIGGTPWLGAVLVVSVAVILAPQVRLALRLDHLPGLSFVTVGLALADAAAWSGFGLLTADTTLMFYGVVLASGASIIGWRLVATRARARPATAKGGAAYTSPS
jgi:uncharacterized protein with PQ loop repeat